MLVIHVLLHLHSKTKRWVISSQSLRKSHVIIRTGAWYFISILDFRLQCSEQAFLFFVLEVNMTSFHYSMLSYWHLLLIVFLLILCFQVAKRGGCLWGGVDARALGAGPVGTVAAQNGLWVITGVQAVLCCGKNDRTDAHFTFKRVKRRQQQQDYVCRWASWTWPCDWLAAWL